mgnify:CR=1 FL=1
MRVISMVLLVVFSLQLAGCASVSEVKAPCDYYGHFCGAKKRINH